MTVLLAIGAFQPAGAVVNVRNVAWDTPAAAVATSPATSRARVTFDADLSAVEMMFGTTSFSIATMQAGHQPQILVRYSVGPIADPPQAGTSVRIELELDLQCNGHGSVIHADPHSSQVRYVDPLMGQIEQRIQPSQRFGASVDVWADFALVLLDEDGNPSYAVVGGGGLVCEPVEAADTSIGVYFDPQGTQCSGTIAPGEIGTVYIVAKYGAQTPGIAGAEFRFAGLPDSWEVAAVPNPEILAVGDPFGDGVVTGFPCPQPEARRYVLYEVLVQAGDVQEDVVLMLEMRSPPTNPSLQCPVFVSCDAPRFSQTCVETVPCFVNATKPTPCAAPVSVAQTTWTAVKRLFR